MKKLYLASVWAPGAIPAEEWKYRNLKRVMFPAIDLLFFIGGLFAARFGIPSVSEFFSNTTVSVFSVVMSVAAFVCLLGVSFPKLWALEMSGKAILLGLMVGYIAALVILAIFGKHTGAFSIIVAAIAICQIIWRITLLGSEWQDRILTHKVNASLLKAQAEKEGNSG